MSDILYHYTNGNGFMGIMESSELHCSHISLLNDPSEHIYFDEVLNKVLLDSKGCKTIYDSLYNDSYFGGQYYNREYYVLSFSRNGDSLSMWNYYSNGNGYNLGLNIENIIKNNTGKVGHVSRIELVYDEIEQYKLLKKYIESFKNELARIKKLGLNIPDNSYEDDQLTMEFIDGLISMRLRFKHSGYDREEEIRFLVTKPEWIGRTNFYRISKNGVVVEYIKLSFDIKKDLESITIHPLGNSLHLEGLKRYLNSKGMNGKLKLENSKLPFRSV